VQWLRLVECCAKVDAFRNTQGQDVRRIYHIPGMTSLMYIIPVRKLKWNLLGVLLLQQATCERNMADAVCKANCFRMSQRDDGVDMVRIMNCGEKATMRTSKTSSS
jgi:hypothetical protein